MSSVEQTSGPFLIDKVLFDTEIKRSYITQFEPETMIQFAVLLPFRIPARGLCMTVFPERHVGQTFLFHEIQVIQEIPEGVLGTDLIKLPQDKTRVEMAYITSEELIWDNAKEEQGVHLMQEVFHALLAGLNTVLTGYVLATHHGAVHRVTEEMLGPVYFGRFVPLRKWDQTRLGGYLVNEPLLPERDEVTAAQVERWKDRCNELSKGENQFLIVQEIALTADRLLRQGLYPEAVVHAQTAVEVFLWSVYGALCSTEGKTVPPDMPFITLVKAEMPSRLGGNWSLKDSRYPTAQWFLKTYELRNRIVHGGRFPTKEEAAEAISAADEFRDWVVSRIEANRTKYSHLASQVIQQSSSGQ